MINNDVIAGNFFYCVNHWFPGDSKKYHNSGNLFYHQYSYLIDGSCSIEFRDTEDGEVVTTIDSATAIANGTERLLDHTGIPLYETISTDDGVTIMFISPTDITKPITAELKKAGTHTIVATDKRITIVCVRGPVQANEQELINMQYAVVLPGKSAELIIPENGICALVSYA